MRAATRRRGSLEAALLTLTLLGCDDDSRRTISLDGDGGGDAVDAAVTPRPQDAGMDGGPIQHPASCEGTTLLLPLGDSPSRSFAAAVEANRIHVVFVAPACGGATSSGQGKGLRYTSFTTSTEAAEPVPLGDESCGPVREPTLVAHGVDDVALYFGSARGEQFELYRGDLVDKASPPTPLTTSPAFEVELSAAALGTTRVATLAYVSATTLAEPVSSGIYTRQGAAEPLEAVAVALGHDPSGLALVGHQAAGSGALLAWRNRAPQSAGLYLRSLNEQGGPAGDIVELSRTPGPRSTIALASRDQGVVGIVYTELGLGDLHELRYRAWGAEGLSAPIRLTGAGTDVTQVALSHFRSGFLVAYRARDPQGQDTVRLLSLETNGNAGPGSVLASTTDTGTSLQVLFAADGRIVVAWDELAPRDVDAGTDPPAPQLHVERLTCR